MTHINAMPALFRLLALLLLSVGCGGGATPPPMISVDPLIGTWSRTSPPDSDFSSAKGSLTFTSTGTFTQSGKRVYTSTATGFASCTETSTTNAGTYSTTDSAGARSITTSGITTFTIVRTGCATATNNGTSTQTQTSAADTFGYAISGNTLTLTETASGMPVSNTFTRDESI